MKSEHFEHLEAEYFESKHPEAETLSEHFVSLEAEKAEHFVRALGVRELRVGTTGGREV